MIFIKVDSQGSLSKRKGIVFRGYRICEAKFQIAARDNLQNQRCVQISKSTRAVVMVMVMVFIYRIFYMIYSNAVYISKGEIGHQHI